MTRHRRNNLAAAALGSVFFAASMGVTRQGLAEIAAETRRPPSAVVLALPIMAAVGVPVLFCLVACFEKPTDRRQWREQFGGARHHPRCDTPRDERFARAYRIGRRANAVGRNCFEVARIRRATCERLSSLRRDPAEALDPALR